MSDDVREEAERLVAAALAAASFALRNAGQVGSLAGLAERFLGGGHIATGTPECCICPVCRGIAALRDPDPEFAARVASGASDLAAGLTTILRAVNSVTAGARPKPPPPRAPEGGPTWRAATRDEDWPVPEPDEPAEYEDPWHAATAARDDPWHPATAAPPRKLAEKKIAKKAVKKAPPEDLV
jgi:hypothetical protein